MHPLTNKELWKLCELMESFYISREYADFSNRGGANYSENPCKALIQNKEINEHINKVVIPAICQEVYNLLDPNYVDENEDKEVTK